jgi:hypothetical protein
VPAVLLEVAPLAVVPEPAVELVDPEELLAGLAFVKMNDAPELDPDGVRDAVEPVVEPLVVPLVPVALPISPRCRQPTTVMVPLGLPDLAEVCVDPLVCGLLVCAAATAAHANPIANIAPALFIDASLFMNRRGGVLQESFATRRHLR